jgi:hypothetical protein
VSGGELLRQREDARAKSLHLGCHHDHRVGNRESFGSHEQCLEEQRPLLVRPWVKHSAPKPPQLKDGHLRRAQPLKASMCQCQPRRSNIPFITMGRSARICVQNLDAPDGRMLPGSREQSHGQPRRPASVSIAHRRLVRRHVGQRIDRSVLSWPHYAGKANDTASAPRSPPSRPLATPCVRRGVRR